MHNLVHRQVVEGDEEETVVYLETKDTVNYTDNSPAVSTVGPVLNGNQKKKNVMIIQRKKNEMNLALDFC